MDTRGRSPRESWRPSTRDQRADGTERMERIQPDPPVAELVELSPVPQPKRRGMTPTALGVALFAAGLLAGSSLVRLVPADVASATTEPTAGGTAVAASGAVTLSPAPTRTTPRPSSSAVPTPAPTPVPTNVPWVWPSDTFTEGGSPNGVWSAGGRIVVAIVNGGDSGFRTSDDGFSWITNSSSRAIADYVVSATIKDRLWFVLRVAGLQEEHFELGYPTWTEDGANVTWTTKGPFVGAAPDWVGALGQVNGTWVMSPGHYTGGGDGGSMDISISDDGTHWSTVQPAGAENVAIYQMVGFGSKLVAFGQLQGGGGGGIALTTTDGRHWKSAAFPVPADVGMAVYRMSCGAAACVAVGSTMPNGPERPAMWRTTDGLHWEPVATDITDARQDGYMSSVVATDSGFLALGSPDTDVLVSRDGVTWRGVNVLARQDTGNVQQLVLNGNVIFGLGYDAIGQDTQWVGSVDELPFP